jgi:hypothetical protein
MLNENSGVNVAETHPPPVTRRRALVGAAAAVAIAAVAVLAFLLWPSGGGKTGIRERALAAVGGGSVLHVITSAPTGDEFVSLRTGRTIASLYEVESWSDRSSRRFHDVVGVTGQVVNEAMSTHPASGGVDPNAVWSGYRQDLASGRAKLERSGRLYGHGVYWLEFPSHQHQVPGSEVAVDRRTYRPVALRVPLGNGGSETYRVLLARTEGFSAAEFRRRAAPQGLPASTTYELVGSALTDHPTVTKPWLRTGSTVAGVKLSSVQHAKLTMRGRTSRVIELVYGNGGDPSAAPLLIREQKQPDPSSRWDLIPPGSIRIDEMADAGTARRMSWTGQLALNRTYLTIASSISRAAVLEAARSLRPA